MAGAGAVLRSAVTRRTDRSSVASAGGARFRDSAFHPADPGDFWNPPQASHDLRKMVAVSYLQSKSHGCIRAISIHRDVVDVRARVGYRCGYSCQYASLVGNKNFNTDLELPCNASSPGYIQPVIRPAAIFANRGTVLDMDHQSL